MKVGEASMEEIGSFMGGVHGDPSGRGNDGALACESGLRGG